jgi:hypothetical protein
VVWRGPGDDAGCGKTREPGHRFYARCEVLGEYIEKFNQPSRASCYNGGYGYGTLVGLSELLNDGLTPRDNSLQPHDRVLVPANGGSNEHYLFPGR